MRRTMRMARLLDLTPGRRDPMDLIQPLCDAAVISMADNKITISGIERYEVFASVMQTWFIEVISTED